MTTPAPAQSAPRIRDTSSQLLIVIGGIVTSLLVVGLNWLLGRELDIDLLSMSLWFVLPVGAIFGGLGAASGYFAVAKLTQTMPSKSLLFNMVAVGVSCWLLHHWLEYATLVLEDGTRARDLVSFWEFFRLRTEHMQLSVSIRNTSAGQTGELGTLGYVREGLQLLGFMVGGIAAYINLTEAERCDSCKKYARKSKLLEVVDAERFDTVAADSGVVFPDLVETATAALKGRPLAGIDLNLLECPSCHAKWLRPSIVVASGNSYVRVRLMRYNATDTQAQNIQRVSRVPAPPPGNVDAP